MPEPQSPQQPYGASWHPPAKRPKPTEPGGQQQPYFPPPLGLASGARQSGGPGFRQGPGPLHAPPRPPGKSRRTRNMILSIVGGLVLVIVIAVVAIAGRNPNNLTINTTSPTSSPASNVNTTPPPALSPTETTVQLVKDWYNNRAQTSVTEIADDFGQFTTDATNGANSGDFSAALTDCRTIQADVQAAQALPPIPDPPLEQQWSAAMSDYASMAGDCISGLSNSDPSLIQQATTEEADGTTALQTLITDIQNLGS